MRAAVVGALLFATLVGCSTRTPDPTPALDSTLIETLTCKSITQVVQVTCLIVPPNALLLQTAAQVTVRTSAFAVTFDSTIILFDEAEQRTIAPLDGISVVSAGETTRIVHPGSFVSIDADFRLSAPQPYQPDSALSESLDQLERPVSLPEPIQIPTVPAAESTTIPTGCLRPPEWTHTYTVQRGDTLSRIAEVYGVTVDTLQEYNCLLNPNQLAPGDVLYVPTASIASTATPFAASFTADSEVLQAGECTTIHWDAAAASVVYFQGEATARTDSRTVCPELTSTYTLLMIDANGAQMGYTLTITIE